MGKQEGGIEEGGGRVGLVVDLSYLYYRITVERGGHNVLHRYSVDFFVLKLSPASFDFYCALIHLRSGIMTDSFSGYGLILLELADLDVILIIHDLMCNGARVQGNTPRVNRLQG